MNRYKLVDKETKKTKGTLKCNMDKLVETWKPRIVAGLCCTLIVGSTIGVLYESVTDVVDNDKDEVIRAAYTEFLEESYEIAHIRNEIDERTDYLDTVFTEMNEDVRNYPVIIELKDSYVSILQQGLVTKEDMFQYSDLRCVRDDLRDICDSVKNVLEQLEKSKNKDEDEDRKENDKEAFPFGDKKNDIFYKESLNTGRRL